MGKSVFKPRGPLSLTGTTIAAERLRVRGLDPAVARK